MLIAILGATVCLPAFMSGCFRIHALILEWLPVSICVHASSHPLTFRHCLIFEESEKKCVGPIQKEGNNHFIHLNPDTNSGLLFYAPG